MFNVKINNAKIKGISTVIPKKELCLTDDKTLYNGNEKQLKRVMKSSGFNKRRVVENGVTSADLCQRAAGIIKSVEFSDEFKQNNIVEFEMMFQNGDKIDAFNGSNGTLGTMILKFSSMDEMLYKMDNMDEFIKVNVEPVDTLISFWGGKTRIKSNIVYPPFKQIGRKAV